MTISLAYQWRTFHKLSKIYFQIPERDQAGNIIPDWKRQMMAKKAAEKAKKEFEERMAKEAENRRLSQIPQWKRDLLARREETENKLKLVYNDRTKFEYRFLFILLYYNI